MEPQSLELSLLKDDKCLLDDDKFESPKSETLEIYINEN